MHLHIHIDVTSSRLENFRDGFHQQLNHTQFVSQNFSNMTLEVSHGVNAMFTEEHAGKSGCGEMAITQTQRLCYLQGHIAEIWVAKVDPLMNVEREKTS